jgi:PAS domain S-box-containing protein
MPSATPAAAHEQIPETDGTGLTRCSRDLRYISANRAYAEIAGLPVDQIVGRPIEEVMGREALETIRPYFDRVLRGETVEYVSEVPYRAGGPRFLKVVYTPSREGDGTISGWVASVTDISALKEAEAALRVKERRDRALLENAPVGIVHTDLSGRIEYVNEAFCRLLGYTSEELLNKTGQDITHPDDFARQQSLRKRVLAGELPDYVLEKRYVRKDGSSVWVNLFGNFVADDDGRPIQGVGVVVDVTRRRAADEQLRASEERFRELANNIDQFAWTSDRLGYANWYNDRWYQYTGTTFADMQGDGWTRVVHPAHVERVLSRVPQCIQEGRVWEDTFPIRGKDGQYRWFLSRAVPIHDASGQVIRWFGTNTDVTELRDLQEALEEANRRKDELLARTRDLADSLATVRENERRAAAVSLHEGVAQELYAAQLSVQQLERRGRGRSGVMEIAKELSRIIDQSIEHVRNLTDVLYPTSLVHVRVSKALEQLGRQFAKRSGVRVVVDELLDFPELKAEIRLLFFRAAQEALTNVARHAKASTVRITLEADTERIAMRVVDDGNGIAADDLHKAGSLGLIGIRERFAAFGGGVTVERGASCGTCLIVFLPSSKSNLVTAAQPATRGASLTMTKGRRASPKKPRLRGDSVAPRSR